MANLKLVTGWWNGVETQDHNGLGRDGMPTTVREVLDENPIERSADEQERVRMCELHAQIIQTTAQIEWHASEVGRVTGERKAAQDELATIIARLGIVTK